VGGGGGGGGGFGFGLVFRFWTHEAQHIGAILLECVHLIH